MSSKCQICMTPAELKTLRESLGLSINWLAEQTNVNARSAQYWESGERSVPKDVADMLTNLDRDIESRVQETCQNVHYLIVERGTAPESISLVRYRTDADLWRYRPDMKPLPTTAHAALLTRLRRELFKMGIISRVVYMIPAIYELWLERTGKKDSEESREEWATTRIE